MCVTILQGGTRCEGVDVMHVCAWVFGHKPLVS